MYNKPIIISSQPDDTHFVWHLDVQISRYLELKMNNEVHYLMFKPEDRAEWNPKLDKLREKYKEFENIKFFFYEDDGTLLKKVRGINYIPLLRPFCLAKHFEKYPELEKECFYYCDADTLLVNKFDFAPFLEDEICYLSYTGGRFQGGNYLDLSYLEGKVEQVLPERRQLLKNIDVIQKMAECAGITREIIEKNNPGTGGAQYLLKGLNADFWYKVLESCLKIRPLLMNVNQMFFEGRTSGEKENNGFQSFCTDMWAVLYNLWRIGRETKCPKEFDFAWATDPIEKLEEVNIFHNAGVPASIINIDGKPVRFFFKGRYVNNDKVPYQELEMYNDVSPKHCTYFYLNQLKKVTNPII